MNETNPFFERGLIIMVGLPLAGKSTIAKICSSCAPVVLVSSDNIRLSLCGQKFSGNAENQVWGTVYNKVVGLLQQRRTVLVDATNITKENRRFWAKVAREFAVRFSILFVDTPWEVCCERNSQLNRIPQTRFLQMKTQFEVPSSNEGILYSLEDIEKWLKLIDPKICLKAGSLI